MDFFKNAVAHAATFMSPQSAQISMNGRCSFFLFLAGLACAPDRGPVAPVTPPPSPVANVRLREVEISALPSPFYRFQYDVMGRLTSAAYSSDLRTYDILYEQNRMVAMQSTGSVHDRLTYVYNEAGKVTQVTYADALGSIYARIFFTYAGEHLVTLERRQRVGALFQADKRMSFVYGDDGNVVEITDQRFAFAGQTEATLVDRYERYDTGINVDGFSLIHSEFFDHLVLLPGVRLQVGNPGTVTRSGSGVNYRVDYSYTYDRENRPLTKHGEGVIGNGSNAGQRFQTNSRFSYD